MLTRSSEETTRSFARAELSAEGCVGATHFVSAIRFGALRVNVDGGAGCHDEDRCDAPVVVRVVPLARSASR